MVQSTEKIQETKSVANQAQDGSTELSFTDRLALERTRIAYERTMMAWIRTATSLITFGFAVYKFFQLDMSGKHLSDAVIGTRGFALVLIVVGLLALLFGSAEYLRDIRFLKNHYPGMPRTMTGVGVILLAILGLLALAAVLVRG